MKPDFLYEEINMFFFIFHFTDAFQDTEFTFYIGKIRMMRFTRT